MKQFIPLLVLSAVVLLAVACGVDETPTPTIEPGLQTPTSTPTPSPATPTPTPSVTREWALKGINVEGSTVTVELQVFAGIDVQVTLDGRQPDEIAGPPPTLKHTFLNVAPGDYTVRVSDVVGYVETARVVVKTVVDAENPQWLTNLVSGLEGEPPANPPMTITRYEFKGQTVYFQTAPCCDFFSSLYDTDGSIIGHPDGGITGQGDGRVPDFFEKRENGLVIWEDKREHAPDTVQVLAPMERVDLNIAESFPLQYFLSVTSGLPNSCHTFGGYTVTRDGTIVRVRVYNSKPRDTDIVCAQVYGTVETAIPLGSIFDSTVTYTVDVNGEIVQFRGDQVTFPLERPTPTPTLQTPLLEEVQRELDRNILLWESRGLENYQMDFQWLCFCPPEYVEPVVVSVRNGDTIDAVVFIESGLAVDQSHVSRYTTIDGLFDLLQEAIDRNAFSISVEYDAELGHPLRASIDYDHRVADEERGFVAGNITPAP